MKARRLIVGKTSGVEIETFEVPEPGPGEVVIRVNRSQISAGSETSGYLSALSGTGDKTLNPGVKSGPTGYNTIGRVLTVGPGMKEYKPGDRVMTFGNHGSHWLTGQPSRTGSTIAPSIQRIEYDLTDEQAAFSRLGDVAMHGVRRGEIQVDESVVVFGQGVVGQLTTAFCRVSGAYPVVAVDIDAGRLELAKKSGATHTVDASKEDAIEAVKQITGGGAECAFHATRLAQTFLDCIAAAAIRGKVVVIGFPRESLELNLRPEFLKKELQIRASNAAIGIENNVHPYWRWTLQRARTSIMRMIADGDIKVDHLISHVAKPEEADALYRKMAAGPTGWMSIFFDWEDEAS